MQIKYFKKQIYIQLTACLIAVFHVFTFSIPASFADAHTVQNGSVNNWETFNVAEGNDTTITVVDMDGNPMADGHAIINVLQDYATQIYANLDTIGFIAIMNAAGFDIGPDANINVTGGLILSTLGINEQQFFEGMAALNQDPSLTPGFIENQGHINVDPGSFIALIAGAIKNTGTIAADGGTAVIAAGSEGTLAIGGDGLVEVQITKAVEAEVFDFQGNKVADQISNSGVINAEGGFVKLTAQGAEEVFDNIINHSGAINATSASVNDQGEIVLDGGDEGVVRISGTLDASGKDAGEKGGKVQVLGEKVGLYNGAAIDASGNSGGGTILIGGDYKGENPEVRNAYAVYMDRDASLNASAIESGNGGKIIFWSDYSTRVYGEVLANGGAAFGNGGFIETSSHNFLDVAGIGLSASATHGAAGLWLLDPRNITIQDVNTANGTFSGASPDVFSPNADNAIVDVDDINTRLDAGTSVTIQTVDGGGSQSGDITISGNILKSAGASATLTLLAENDILGGSGYSFTSSSNALNIVMTADSDSSGTGSISLTAFDITTNGGTLAMNGADGITLDGDTDFATGAGTITINADSDSDGTGTFTLSNATGTLTSSGATQITAGDIALTGTINSGAAATTLLVAEAGRTMALGAGAGSFSLSGAELQLITATGLTFGSGQNGNITVDNITAANSNNISGTTTINATRDNTTITFSGTASIFNALTANADQQIDMDVDLTTDVGALSLDGDFDNAADTNDNIDLAAGVDLTSAGAITLAALTGGLLLSGGDGTTNVIDSNGDALVILDGITDTNNPNLTINSEGGISTGHFGGITILGTGAVNFTVDSDNDGTETLSFSSLFLGTSALTLSGGGTGTNDTLTLNANIGSITGSSLNIQNFNLVNIGSNTGLTASNGALMVSSNVGSINLTSVNGTTNTFDGNGDALVSLAAITDDNNPNLTVNSEGGLTLAGAVSLGTGTHIFNADNDNDGSATLQVASTLTGGAITLRGGTGTTETIDIDGDVVAASTLTIQNAATIDLAAGVDLTASNGALTASSNVTLINLSGAGATTNIIDGNGDALVSLAAITDTNNVNLTVNSEAGITLAGATSLGTGTYSFTVDNDNDSSVTLAINSAITGSAALVFSSGGVVGTDSVNQGADITGASITAQNFNAINLASNADITASNGAITMSSNVGSINLIGSSGTTNVIDGNGDALVSLAAITDATPLTSLNLTVNSEGSLTLAGAVSLGLGTHAFNADNDDDGSATLTISGATTSTGAFTVTGSAANNDTLTFANTFTAGSLAITNAGNVNFDNVVTTTTTLTQSDGGGTTTFSAANVIGTNASIANDAITFSGAGSLTANAGAGTISLTAQTGAITSGTAAADIVGAATTLTAATGIGSGANAFLTTIASLDGSVTGTGDMVITETNGITLTDVDTADGSITISAGGAIIATDVAAAGATYDVSLTTTAGDIELGVISATDDVTISSAGSIVEIVGSEDAGVDISGDAVVLTAADEIGGAGELDIETTIASLDASSTSAGNIVITETNAINLLDVDTVSGTVTVVAGGAITATDVVAAGAGQDVNLTTSVGDVEIGVVSAADDVTINSAGSIVEIVGSEDAGVDISGDAVTLTAADEMGGAGELDLETTIASLDASSTSAGNIVITETNAINLLDVDTVSGTITVVAGGAITATDVVAAGAGQDVNLTTSAGDVEIGAITAADDVTISSAGSIVEIVSSEDAGVDISGDAVTLTAVDEIGGAGELDVETTIASLDASSISAGDITITETNGINLFDLDTVDGTITINAGGAITATDVVAAGAGQDVNLTTSAGDVEIGVITATDDVTISSAGSIVEIVGSEDAGVDISGDAVTLTATDEIGGAGELDVETTIASLDASSTTAGNIVITETNAINLLDVDTANGAITIVAGGAITATDIAAAGANDISLTATTGNITVESITSGSGTVTLTAQSGSILSGVGVADIIAANLIMIATGSIGAVGNFMATTIDRLEALSGNTGIFVSDSAGGLIIGGISGTNGVASTGGGVTIRSAAGTVTLSERVQDSGGGSITINANGNAGTDDLAINANITASGGTGTILLTAGDTLTIANGATVSTVSTGTISVAAGENYADTTLDRDGTTTGDITMAAGAIIQTDEGNIDLDARDSMTLDLVDANADDDGVRGDVSLYANEEATIANAGTILDANEIPDNIIADDFIAVAFGDIGTALDKLEINANNNNVSFTGAGLFYPIAAAAATDATDEITFGGLILLNGKIIGGPDLDVIDLDMAGIFESSDTKNKKENKKDFHPEIPSFITPPDTFFKRGRIGGDQ